MRNRQIIQLILLGALLAAGCTPQKRLERLVRKHPELAKTKTEFRIDSVSIPEIEADTVFQKGETDTVYLKRGGLQIKYFSSMDTVFICGRCKDTVIVREVPVKVNEVTVRASQVPRKKHPIRNAILFGFIAGAGIVTGYRILRKRALI